MHSLMYLFAIYCVVRWHKYVLFTCMFVFLDAEVQIWFMRTTRRRLCVDRFCANNGIKSLTISRCTHRGHSLAEIYYRRQIRGMSIVPFFTQSILNVIRCLTRFLQNTNAQLVNCDAISVACLIRPDLVTL